MFALSWEMLAMIAHRIEQKAAAKYQSLSLFELLFWKVCFLLVGMHGVRGNFLLISWHMVSLVVR